MNHHTSPCYNQLENLSKSNYKLIIVFSHKPNIKQILWYVKHIFRKTNTCVLIYIWIYIYIYETNQLIEIFHIFFKNNCFWSGQFNKGTLCLFVFDVKVENMLVVCHWPLIITVYILLNVFP